MEEIILKAPSVCVYFFLFESMALILEQFPKLEFLLTKNVVIFYTEAPTDLS